MTAMGLVVFWVLCGVVAAIIGEQKGSGCTGFMLGLLFGPFGILFAALAKGDRKQCPHCKERMHKDATVCPHCQRDVGTRTAS
jgi:hypothetical protein